MRKKEEIYRDLVVTEPQALGEEERQYKRDKVMLEVMLDTRELLEKLVLKQELQEKKAMLLESGLDMGEME